MTTQEKIGSLLEEFDFNKVHRVMEFLKWEWIGKGVPSLYHLVKAAEKHLLSAVEQLENEEDKEQIYVSASGGFSANAWYYDGELKLKISFKIEELNNF